MDLPLPASLTHLTGKWKSFAESEGLCIQHSTAQNRGATRLLGVGVGCGGETSTALPPAKVSSSSVKPKPHWWGGRKLSLETYFLRVPRTHWCESHVLDVWGLTSIDLSDLTQTSPKPSRAVITPHPQMWFRGHGLPRTACNRLCYKHVFNSCSPTGSLSLRAGPGTSTRVFTQDLLFCKYVFSVLWVDPALDPTTNPWNGLHNLSLPSALHSHPPTTRFYLLLHEDLPSGKDTIKNHSGWGQMESDIVKTQCPLPPRKLRVLVSPPPWPKELNYNRRILGKHRRLFCFLFLKNWTRCLLLLLLKPHNDPPPGISAKPASKEPPPGRSISSTSVDFANRTNRPSWKN